MFEAIQYVVQYAKITLLDGILDWFAPLDIILNSDLFFGHACLILPLLLIDVITGTNF